MDEPENIEDSAGNSTAIIAHYGTVLVAPDDLIPSPSRKDVLKAENEAVENYRALLVKYRKEGLVVAMAYVEAID